MKIKNLLAIVIVVLITVSGFSQDRFTKTGTNETDETVISVLTSDNSGTSIKVNVNGFYTGQSVEGDAVYDNVYLRDHTSLGETGQASLPVIVKMIAIPNNVDVKVKVLNTTSENYDGFNVLPSQEFPMRDGTRKEFRKDALYYSTDALLPSELVEVREIAAFRDYRVAIIAIHPMQYNPAERTLTVYSEIEFDLSYEGFNNTNNVIRSKENESKIFRGMYEKFILNYEYVTDGNTGTNEGPNMVIITADALYNSILPLAAWRNQKGIRTDVVKMTDIGGGSSATSDQIKTYLQTLYTGPDRPEFALLVGDARGQNIVPWFTVGFDKTDHPYSCLDGSDVLPDIALGRISVQSPAELDTVVAMMLQYEKQPNLAQTDWYKRALVLRSNDGIDPINGQVAKDVFLNDGGFTNVDVATPSTSQSQITNYLNGGVSWVWFIGHGYEQAWADPYWHMSNMPNLTYGKRQPTIISIACSNADLDWAETNDCFGEEFLERSTVNSSLNMCASTELCAFYTTDTLGRYMLYGYFREDMNDFGTMMNYGKVSAYNYFNGNGTVKETINQFLILGDPTQEAYSDVPAILTVTTTQGGSPTATITVNVKSNGTNVEGALVGINQNSELKVSGYTNAQGNFEFSSSELINGFPVQAVVTGRNFVPYIQDIITNLTNGTTVPDNYELAQNFPNPFNPSTMIRFGIPQNSFVTLKIYDMLGREVATLVNDNLNAGTYDVDFNAVNLSSGVYFYRITTGEFTQIKKMTLIK